MKMLGFAAFDCYRATSISEDHDNFHVRTAIVVSSVIYGFARFGVGAGEHVLVASAAFLFLDWAQLTEGVRPRLAVRTGLVLLQVFVVGGLFFAASPVSFGLDVPTPIMLESPFFLVLICLLASYVSAARPTITLFAGLGIIAVWLAARHIALADPLTITRADIDVARYKTMISLFRAINRPHYFNEGLWADNLVAGITVTAVLTFAAYRAHRLAVRTARQVGLRDALAAHFSPQVVELLVGSRDVGLTRWSKELAVLDCDLVGFTTLAEKLAPERVAEVLLAYRTAIEKAVFGAGGAIVSYTGDGVTAIIGLIGDSTSAAAGAVICAESIVHIWADVGRSVLGTDAPSVAIGVDFGAARAGLVGDIRTLSLLLLGEPVAGAAKLQAMTRDVAAQILLSDAEKRAAIATDPELGARLRPVDVQGTTVWSVGDG